MLKHFSKTKVAAAVAASALTTMAALPSAQAGEGVVERVSINLDAGTVVNIAGGEGKLSIITFKIGARDASVDQGVVEVKSGSAKDVTMVIKTRSVTNVGGKVRQGVVSAGTGS